MTRTDPISPRASLRFLSASSDRWDLSPHDNSQPDGRCRDFGCAPGGDMLFKAAIVLLAIWLLGMVGVYRVGDLVQVFLLVGTDVVVARDAQGARRSAASAQPASLRLHG